MPSGIASTTAAWPTRVDRGDDDSHRSAGPQQAVGEQHFLTHHADIVFFNDLINRIRAFAERHKRDIEKYLPSILEPQAWSKAYEIYEAFVELDNAPPDPAVLARVNNRAQAEERWNRYLVNHAAFMAVIHRGDVSPTSCNYLGLFGEDLFEPMMQTDHGPQRRTDWYEVSERVSYALSKWGRMSAGEKAAIPQVMAARRLEAANRELAARLSAVEARQGQAA